MYLLSIFLSLKSFLILAVFGRYIGKKGSIIVSLICLFLSLFIALFIFYEVGLKGDVCLLKLGSWFDVGEFYIEWGFFFDTLTAIMLIVVLLVSSLVHMYSVSYMENDPHFIRFMSYLSLFTFFMLILVTADNYVQLFIGWEGVGLCSYLLVNFWYTREQANKSAMKAIIVNRIGDLFFLLAILIIFFSFKTVNFLVINAVSAEYDCDVFPFLGFNFNILTVASIFIFLAAVGKSAQIGLHTWLPDAMEGPTPVSALIHAATMVTAGIFLVLRSSFILEYSELALFFITIFGALTAIFASTSGLFQNDLKKVIAYSTCSQLGFMFFACGSSNYSVAMFHLANHAFFKALLFLGAGVVIHALNDEQDMRKMGGVFSILPFTFTCMVVASLALAGFPFLTGFYSKDIILETIALKYNGDAIFAYILASISTFFTAFYSFRLLVLVFLVDYKGTKKVLLSAHDTSIFMYFPLLILSFFSIFAGYLLKDMFIGFGTPFWLNSFVISNIFIQTSEFLPIYIKLLPFFASLFGMLLASLIYLYSFTYIFSFFRVVNSVQNEILKRIYVFLSKKWHVDVLYNKVIVKNVLFVGYHHTFKVIDRGVIELFGPLGLVRLVNNLSKKVGVMSTGFIYHYFFYFIFGILFFIFIIYLPFIFLGQALIFGSSFFIFLFFFIIVCFFLEV